MTEVNYIAILAAAILNMLLGFVWYSPMLFGKQWSELMGWGKMSEKEMKKKQQEAMPAYMWSFVGSLLMAYVFVHVLNAFGDKTLAGGAQGGFWMWLGFVAPVMLSGNMFNNKPLKLFYIDGGYRLVSLIAMGALLAYWV
jgi:hypothetical protein